MNLAGKYQQKNKSLTLIKIVADGFMALYKGKSVGIIDEL